MEAGLWPPPLAFRVSHGAEDVFLPPFICVDAAFAQTPTWSNRTQDQQPRVAHTINYLTRFSQRPDR